MDWIIKAIEQLSNIANTITETIVNIFSYIVSILWFLFYAWKTLLVWVFKLLWNILEWWVFVNVASAFEKISYYIGGPATIFICALLFVIIIRIIVAFVFKILRLNMDYNTMKTDWKTKQEWDRITAFQKKYREF